MPELSREMLEIVGDCKEEVNEFGPNQVKLIAVDSEELADKFKMFPKQSVGLKLALTV